jgi:hypothetical protein
MSDDIEDSVGPATQLAPETDPEILLYDYSKYLLTLSMLILGGVLTISQSGDVANRPPPHVLLTILIPIAGSGFLSLSCLAAIVRSRVAGKPQTNAAKFNQAAMGMLGAGVAAFLVSWIMQLM